MFRSKEGILDNAGNLAAKLDALDKEISALDEKVNTVLSGKELLKAGMKEHFANPLGPYSLLTRPNEAHIEVFSDNWHKIAAAVLESEKLLQQLMELAKTKNQLLDSARSRPEVIKTGNVKVKIDKDLPNEKIIKLADKLQKVYEKFNVIAPIVIANACNKTQMKYDFSTLSDQAKNFYFLTKERLDSIETHSKKLDDMFAGLNTHRTECGEYLKMFHDFFNGLGFAEALRVDERSATRKP